MLPEGLSKNVITVLLDQECVEVVQIKRFCIDFSILSSRFHVIHYKTNLHRYPEVSPLLTVE